MTATMDYVVTTGDFIREWMESEGINAAELARRLGVTPKHVSELVSGKAPLSHAVALDLERVTGVPARVWNQYESGYRSALASKAEEAELSAQYEKAREFPLPYLRKHGYLTAPARDRVATVRELLSLLGVASIEAFWSTWSHGSVAYRRSAAARADSPALAVWLALGERQHRGLGDLPPFDSGALEAVLPTLRSFTCREPTAGLNEARESLRQVGVALSFVPAVPGLGIHGATRWLGETPVLQFSLLWKRDDQMWFTLFHELGHVLLHGHKELFLLGDSSESEREADEFAASLLIPDECLPLLPRRRDVGAVRRLAEEIGVAPSIVLGRAQRITQDFAWGQGLIRPVDVTIDWHGAER
jgi:HTH-type transcriptional regulator/antitoxin HigA